MTATPLTLALLQLPPPATPSDALDAGMTACREAASLGADIAVFPEMWSIGYAACPPAGDARQAWLEAAVAQGGMWLVSFQTLAREVGMAIAVTCLERTDDGPQNAVFLFDRWGRLALHYAKVHTCSFDWEAVLVPGDAFPVADLETAAGPVRVGAMICFDREFPESAPSLPC